MKKQIKITEKVLYKLGVLSNTINQRYGYVTRAGDNFGEPVINSGPCGPFANEFYKAWNSRFSDAVKIVFIMQDKPKECYHVAILLPNHFLYDGGIGVHSQQLYLDKNLDIDVMETYDYQQLDNHSYGLNRTYPRYCPDFDLQELAKTIQASLDVLYNHFT